MLGAGEPGHFTCIITVCLHVFTCTVTYSVSNKLRGKQTSHLVAFYGRITGASEGLVKVTWVAVQEQGLHPKLTLSCVSVSIY